MRLYVQPFTSEIADVLYERLNVMDVCPLSMTETCVVAEGVFAYSIEAGLPNLLAQLEVAGAERVVTEWRDLTRWDGHRLWSKPTAGQP